MLIPSLISGPTGVTGSGLGLGPSDIARLLPVVGCAQLTSDHRTWLASKAKELARQQIGSDPKLFSAQGTTYILADGAAAAAVELVWSETVKKCGSLAPPAVTEHPAGGGYYTPTLVKVAPVGVGQGIPPGSVARQHVIRNTYVIYKPLAGLGGWFAPGGYANTIGGLGEAAPPDGYVRMGETPVLPPGVKLIGKEDDTHGWPLWYRNWKVWAGIGGGVVVVGGLAWWLLKS